MRCPVLLTYVLSAKQTTGESRRNCHPRAVPRHIYLHSVRHRYCVVPAGELPTGERSLPRTPDEDYDVILYKCRNTWTIWLRGEKLGEFETAAPALELADYLALMHSRPAWLLDESGYPLKPIERGTIH